jgi:SNF2 family DNA or RNA helicase
VTVDIIDNRIVINDVNNTLGSIGRSQLSFWNFIPNNLGINYSANLDRQLFLKLVSYLEREEYNFDLKEAAKVYSQALAVVNLSFDNIKRLAANYKDGIYDEVAFSQFREFVTENIFRSLKIHQLKAAYHLYLLGNGANFSVPGSGKTSVVLTVYEKLRSEGKVNTLFVVGPPSSFGPWRNEFKETLDREPDFAILAGGNKEARKNRYFNTADHSAELYLTTYQSLLFDQKELDYFLKQKHIKAFFVVDEAHYIKQIKGNWAQAILKQSSKTAFRCVLTGTPMPKSYTDIFNLFDFLWPVNSPISAYNKSLIKHYEDKGQNQAVRPLLEKEIGPLFYRVRKADLNLKPQNFIPPVVLDMGAYERKIYDAIFKKIKDYSQQEYFNKLGKGRIMRLRQATSYPKLLNSAIEDYQEVLIDQTDLKSIILHYDELEVPEKIKYLINKIKELQKNKEKVVIWSNFIETIHLIEHHFKTEGLHVKIIYGQTPVEGNNLNIEETREKIRDEFVNPDSGLDILIANPAACAESISLHKTCHNAIYYDLSYNAAQYLQSLDRIHRVGGSENIIANYYFLQYKNTIDIDIKKNIDAKSKKMFDVIEHDYSIYSLSMNEPDGDAEAYRRLFMKPKKAKRK